MEPKVFASAGGTFAITHVGAVGGSFPNMVWGHGWNQSSAALLPMAQSLARFASSYLIDFPGFGQSPMPPGIWDTADYADAIAGWLKSLPPRRWIWVGHSFGCRVGIQLAARHPALVSGMVLIAAAGLPRQRTVFGRLRLSWRRRAYAIGKLVVPDGPGRDRLRTWFGSQDFQAAGAMRPIFVRVVNEDLSNAAANVECPVLFIYGTEDKETPPEMGNRFQKLVPGAKLVLLDGFDHLGLLAEGRHQVLHHIQRFINTL